MNTPKVAYMLHIVPATGVPFDVSFEGKLYSRTLAEQAARLYARTGHRASLYHVQHLQSWEPLAILDTDLVAS